MKIIVDLKDGLLEFTPYPDVERVTSTNPHPLVTIDHADPRDVLAAQRELGYRGNDERNAGDVVGIVFAGSLVTEIKTALGAPIDHAPIELRPYLQFDYVNHNDELHTYLVDVQRVECGPYSNTGRHGGVRPGEVHWVMHAFVIRRDGSIRLDADDQTYPRRTFIMTKMVNLQEKGRDA